MIDTHPQGKGVGIGKKQHFFPPGLNRIKKMLLYLGKETVPFLV